MLTYYFGHFSEYCIMKLKKNAPRGGGARHQRPLGSANALSIHFVLTGCWVKYDLSFKNNKTNKEVEEWFIKLICLQLSLEKKCLQNYSDVTS